MKIKSLLLLVFFGVSWHEDLLGSESIVGGFLPYWKAKDGIASFKNHYRYFDQASPFSYDVDDSGHIIDRFSRKKGEWNRFTVFCHKHHIKIVPTLFWNNPEALHRCLSHTQKMVSHSDEIMRIIAKDNVDGICIDYENIDPQDRVYFADFLKYISLKLHEKKLVLYCCVEGRISDYSTGLFVAKGKRAQSEKKVSVETPSRLGTPQAIRRFKKVCANYCDQIIIMGYDEWGLPYLYSNRDYAKQYFISHASMAWLKRVLRYFLGFVPDKKLVLGIPTYGLDFIIYSMNRHDIELKKHKALSFPSIQDLLRQYGCVPRRTSGRELALTYAADNLLHYVCYLDAQAIKDRIDLARDFKIKGVYFFKIDGLEDPAMWSILSEKV